MNSNYLSTADIQDIAKAIHTQLINPNEAVISALRDLFLSDSVDMAKDEFLDNYSFSTLHEATTKDFIDKAQTADFYKDRAVAYAKDLAVEQWLLIEKSIQAATVEVSSSVQSSLRVTLRANS